MAQRAIGMIAAIWIVLAPITSIWLMWEFAFGTLTDYYVGNALISLILFGPPATMVAIYLIWMRKSHD